MVFWHLFSHEAIKLLIAYDIKQWLHQAKHFVFPGHISDILQLYLIAYQEVTQLKVGFWHLIFE